MTQTPYRTHTANRSQGQQWLTSTVNADGTVTPSVEQPVQLDWDIVPTSDFAPGDVVKFRYVDRFGRASTELVFFVGLAQSAQAIITRTYADIGIESYYTINPAQLTLVYRPQGQYVTVNAHLPSFQPWKAENDRRLLWLPEVAAPFRLGQPYLNGKGIVFRIVGTDVETGELILQPDSPDGDFCGVFGMTPDELTHMQAM